MSMCSVSLSGSVRTFCCEGTVELMVNWRDEFHKFMTIDKFLGIDRSFIEILCSKG